MDFRSLQPKRHDCQSGNNEHVTFLLYVDQHIGGSRQNSCLFKSMFSHLEAYKCIMHSSSIAFVLSLTVSICCLLRLFICLVRLSTAAIICVIRVMNTSGRYLLDIQREDLLLRLSCQSANRGCKAPILLIMLNVWKHLGKDDCVGGYLNVANILLLIVYYVIFFYNCK